MWLKIVDIYVVNILFFLDPNGFRPCKVWGGRLKLAT